MGVLADVFNYGGKLQREPTLTEIHNNELRTRERIVRKSINATTLINTANADLRIAHRDKLINATTDAERDALEKVNLNTPAISDFVTVYGYERGAEIATKNTTIGNAILGDSDDFKLEFAFEDATLFDDGKGKLSGQIDLPVRRTDLNTGESYTADLTESGDLTTEIYAKGGQAALDKEKKILNLDELDQAYLATVDAIFRQAGADPSILRLQDLDAGVKKLEDLIFTEKGAREYFWEQGQKRVDEQAEETGTGVTETATGPEPETGTGTGIITNETVDSLGITTDIDISDRNIINKIIEVESGGDPAADSGHAKGLMQLKDATADQPGLGVKPVVRGPNGEISAEENVRFGTDYFDALTEKYNGDLVLASMAYNAGPGAIDEWVEGGRKYEDLPKETQDYVAKIFGEDVREQVKNGTYGQGGEAGRTAPGTTSDIQKVLVYHATPSSSKLKPELLPWKGNKRYRSGHWSFDPNEEFKKQLTEAGFDTDNFIEIPGGAPFNMTEEEYAGLKINKKARDKLVELSKRISDDNIVQGIHDAFVKNGLKIRRDRPWSKGGRITFTDIFSGKVIKDLWNKIMYGDIEAGKPRNMKEQKERDEFVEYMTENPDKFNKIFHTVDGALEEFKEDTVAFYNKYKDSKLEGNNPSNEHKRNLIKLASKDFDFTQAKLNTLRMALSSGTYEEINSAVFNITRGNAPSTEYEQEIVNILTEVDNNMDMRKSNRRINDRLVLGMIAGMPLEVRKEFMPTIKSFAQFGVLDHAGVVSRINADVGLINAQKPEKLDTDLRERLLDFDLFDDNDNLVDAGSLVEIGQAAIAAGDTLGQIQYGIKAGHWIKEWAQSKAHVGIWKKIISWGQAYGHDRNQFSAQPKIKFDSVKNRYRFLAPDGSETGGSFSVGEAQSALGPAGMKLLDAAVEAHERSERLKNSN